MTTHTRTPSAPARVAGRRLPAALPIAALLLTATAEQPALAKAREQVSPTTIQQLRSDLGDSVEIQVDGRTGAARFVAARGDGGLLPDVKGVPLPEQAATFVDRYGSAFGIRSVADDLIAGDHDVDALGMTRYSYSQMYRGLAVSLTSLRFHFDANARLQVVEGAVLPNLALEVAPKIDATKAEAMALVYLAEQDPHVAELIDLTEVTELVVSPAALLESGGKPDDLATLVWSVSVGRQDTTVSRVFVDANTGEIVADLDLVYSALDRGIYVDFFDPAYLVWQEGDALPSGDPNTDDAIDFSGHTYGLYRNTFGLDGQNLAGGPMPSVVHAKGLAGILCFLGGPNAFWIGVALFCDDMTTDDIVGHEWSHGYTESLLGGTNFVYQDQSGALAEAYADIFGEAVDLLNAAGLDAPDVPRAADQCATEGPPALGTGTSHFWNPGGSPYVFRHGFATFSPPIARTTGNVVLADDGVGNMYDACEPISGLGPTDILLVERSTCDPIQQVANAQAAGVAAVIVGNHAGQPAAALRGNDPSNLTPVVQVSGADSFAMRSHLAAGGGVSVTLDGGPITGVQESMQWLFGEGSPLGVIRDLRNPACVSQPGKVSDTSFVCNPDYDRGGVHVNSMVPSHLFTLLAEGGSYNGITVPATNLTVASHIHQRALRYLSPTSDFGSHSSALRRACRDLSSSLLQRARVFGKGPEYLFLGQSDCAALDLAIAAVELEAGPGRCG